MKVLNLATVIKFYEKEIGQNSKGKVSILSLVAELLILTSTHYISYHFCKVPKRVLNIQRFFFLFWTKIIID